MNQPVTVRFSQYDIVVGKLSALHQALSSTKIMRMRFLDGRAAGTLRPLMGALEIVLDPPKSKQMTEADMSHMRAFCQKLRKEFRGLAFFCSLSTPYYMLLCLCALPSLTLEFDQAGRAHLRVSEADARQLIVDETKIVRQFATLANVGPKLIAEREERVRTYLLSGLKSLAGSRAWMPPQHAGA